MLGRPEVKAESVPEGRFFPGGGNGQARERPLPVGRRKVTRLKSGKLDLEMKILVVDDCHAMCKIIRKYLRQNGRKKLLPLDNHITPRAIFWLKK